MLRASPSCHAQPAGRVGGGGGCTSTRARLPCTAVGGQRRYHKLIQWHARRRGTSLVSATSAAELLEVIESKPEDKGAVLGVASELDCPLETTLTCLDGDWAVSWTDLGKGWVSKALMNLFTPSLKMLSFGTLPPVKVSIVDSYNRVNGGSYDLLQVFKLPGSDVTAAMVLGGTCSHDLEKCNRLNVQFTSVRIIPPEDAPPEWRDALEEVGLGAAITAAQGIVAKSTYIDVNYIDEVLRVHKGESGTTYVLRRLEPPAHIPFRLD